jgi:hypothetical protein
MNPAMLLVGRAGVPSLGCTRAVQEGALQDHNKQTRTLGALYEGSAASNLWLRHGAICGARCQAGAPKPGGTIARAGSFTLHIPWARLDGLTLLASRMLSMRTQSQSQSQSEASN